LSDLQKKETSETSNLAALEAELRRLKARLVDEQDRAADAESDRRRTEVEIAKLRDEARTLSEELQRAKTEARTAAEEKTDLEERARAVAGMMDK